MIDLLMWDGWKFVFFALLVAAWMVSRLSRDTLLRRMGVLLLVVWGVFHATGAEPWGVYVYGAVDALVLAQTLLWAVVSRYKSLAWIAALFGLMLLAHVSWLTLSVPSVVYFSALSLLSLAQILILIGAGWNSFLTVPKDKIAAPLEEKSWSTIELLTRLRNSALNSTR